MSQQESQHHVIIGTAGHIDHGKTWLIKALTGIDADTLPEEKRRGITIELGFVFMDEPAFEKQLVFIDVPGHERLVRTMVAGASSIDAALIVIAADEGICQQTREHFDILQLLGIDRGVVVLTKADLVGPSRLEELASEVRGFLKGSLLEGAPVIPASSVTGGGVEDVRQALAEIASFVKRREDSGVFR
ncbi:MAG: GTP-binding protein, partial [Candidatus Aminicenantales bacterium]